MALPPIAEELGNARVLESVLSRLRCERCRRPPVRIKNERGDHLSARATAVVLLEGREDVGRNRG